MDKIFGLALQKLRSGVDHNDGRVDVGACIANHRLGVRFPSTPVCPVFMNVDVTLIDSQGSKIMETCSEAGVFKRSRKNIFRNIFIDFEGKVTDIANGVADVRA